MTKQLNKQPVELTTMQEAFVDAFIETNFDVIKAFEAAGYRDSQSNFRFQAAIRLLKTKAISEAIQERLTNATPAHWITEDIVINKLWREATDYGKGSSQAARINALVWIGKHFGMFAEKKTSEESDVTYNIINYAVPKEQMEKEINKPEVLEHKDDDVVLPEGVLIKDYAKG